MKHRFQFIATSIIAAAMCFGIVIQTGSPAFSAANSTSNETWHHYNKKLPTLYENGIKEYWVQCGGSYQFFAPTSGTIIDKGSNYDTSEFLDDDDRWLTYCDEYGHSLDSFNVCSFCGKLHNGEFASETAIDGSNKVNNVTPLKGFKNVYSRTGIGRGSTVGVSGSITAFSSIYFALKQTTVPSLSVYGGDERYAALSQNIWTYFLFKRDLSTNKLSLYTRESLSSSWVNKYIDSTEEDATNFSSLRFYNWHDASSYDVYCSEIYTVDISSEPTPCNHSFDEHDVCLNCMKHRTAIEAADFAVSGSTVSNIDKAVGFNNAYEVTGKKHGDPIGVNIDLTNVDVIYFALRGDKYIYPFSGGDDGDGAHRIIWSGRWYYILLEKVAGVWNGFVRERGTVDWYTRTVDYNTETNFSSLLRLYNWDGLESVTIYSSEVYCARSAPQVEKASAINIGVWNGSYHFTTTSSIDDLYNAGFNTVIGVNPTWNTNWSTILDYSATKGIKHIVDPRNWDYTNSCYLDWDETAPSYANHSAVQGFMMNDEPNSTQFSSIAQKKQTFESVMPSGKLFFVNLLSSACGLSSLYGTNSATASYSYYETNYAKAYHNTVSPEVYSFDSYPIFTNGKIRKPYLCSFDIWSNLSRQYDIPTWYSLLSAAHQAGDGADYVYGLPTQAQLEWQMSVALSFGVTNLMHYIYAASGSDYSCMANVDGTKNDYYYTVSAANHNILAFDEDLANYGWEGAFTYHNLSKTNLLFKELKHTIQASDAGVSSISASSDCLFGSYIDEGGNRAYMVTNSGYSTDYSSTWASNYTKYDVNVNYVNQANNVSITLDDDIVGAYIIQNGTKTYVSVNNNSIPLALSAYGSAFVIPVK